MVFPTALLQSGAAQQRGGKIGVVVFPTALLQSGAAQPRSNAVGGVRVGAPAGN